MIVSSPRTTLAALRSCLFALALLAGTGAVARSPYRLVIFDSPGREEGFVPAALNNLGHVVGAGYAGRVMVLKGERFVEVGTGYGYGINDKDQVVGGTSADDGRAVATRWGPFRQVFLEKDVTVNTQAQVINDRGEAAGLTFGFDPDFQVVTRWYRGRSTRLGSGRPNAIDNHGRIAGLHYDEAGFAYAAVWSADGMTLLGGADSAVWDMNDLGQAVGNDGGAFARLWNLGADTVDLAAMTGGLSVAKGINSAGDVVGIVVNSPVADGATLWRKTANGHDVVRLGTLIRPDAPSAGWRLTDAHKINDRGDIIGWAVNDAWCSRGEICITYGFLMSHSPLPDRFPTDPP